MVVLGVPGLLNIIIIVYLFVGGPLWPYSDAPALAKNIVLELIGHVK